METDDEADESMDGDLHYTQAYLLNSDNKNDITKSRKKRQADQYEYTPTKTRCPLLLVADYRFFQEMGAGNTKTTINYLVQIMESQFFNNIKNIIFLYR